MKKYILKLIALFVAVIALQSCNSDKIVEQVQATFKHGAILRTVQKISTTYDVADLSSVFSIEIEEQDVKDGALMSAVNVFVKQGTTGNEVPVMTLAPSDFTTGPNGLPRAMITVSLQEAINALGIPASAVNCGGVMNFRLELKLTDGRVFSNDNVSGTVAGGSFFSSPFAYAVGIVANLPSDTLYTSQYQLTTTAPGLYGVADFADGIYTVEAISNTQRVIKQVTTLPAFGGFGPKDIEFDFVCGDIIVPTGQSEGAGCNVAITVGPATVNSTYDINNPDDSSFTINFTSDETTDCSGGGGPVQASIKLVKI